MSFVQLWPLFLLVFIPVIIILYLRKQKAEDLTFSSLFLWREVYKNIEADRSWERLKNNLLMILQILTVLFFILALTSPYMRKGGTQLQNAVLVIDTSGSMNISYDEKHTRFQQAVSEAASYVDSLREGTEITVLSMNKRVVIEGANIRDKTEIKKILAGLQVTDQVGNSSLALNLITSMADQWEEYEAVFYTDCPIDLGQIKGRIVDLNSLGPNLCIEYVNFGYREDGKLTVLVRVGNPSPYFFESDVNLSIDDNIVDIQKVSLEPGQNETLYFDGLEAEGEVIKAELNERDYLMRDNTAYALIQDTGKKRVLLVSKQNIFIEKAVTLVSGVELYKTASPENLGGQEKFDLYIFDGMLPQNLPSEGNLILIDPPGALEGIAERIKNLENVMLTTVNHEAVKYMENYSFGVTGAQGFQTPLWGRTFLKSDGYSVGYMGDYLGRKIGVIGFDFHNSDFPLQSEFPIFIHNLIGLCLEQKLAVQAHYKAGDMLMVNPNPAGSEITLVTPAGEIFALPASAGAKAYDYLSHAGLYRLTQQSESGERSALVSVDFPTGQESKIQSGADGEEGHGGTAGAGEGSGALNLSALCILCALAFLCVEWFVYIKGV